MSDNVLTGLLLAGAAGVGLGIGLVCAAALVRVVRHFMRDDDTPKR